MSDAHTPAPTTDGQGAFRTGRCEVFLSVDLDGVAVERGLGVEPTGVHSIGRYAYRCGVPRYLALFERKGVRVTFFVPGYDAEVEPALIRGIVAAGHEVGAHGYAHESRYVEGEEERDLLRRTHEILSEVTGREPTGWRNPGGFKSQDTLSILHGLGYRYDSSDKDFERPYVVEVGPQAALVQLPTNTGTLDDGYLNEVAMLPASRMLDLWSREFAYCRRNVGYYPLILHGRALWGSGSPARIKIVEQLIDYVRAHEGAAFWTGSEIAARTLEERGEQ